MAKTKVKVITFRQRMRADASKKLDMLAELVGEECRGAVANHSEINPYDVMRLVCSTRTAALRNKLISELANEQEVELEKIYNNQQALALGDNDAD